MDLVDLYNKRLLALAKKLDRKTIEPEDFEVELAEAWSKLKTEALARNTQRQMVVQQKELAKGQAALFQFQKQVREEDLRDAEFKEFRDMFSNTIREVTEMSKMPPSYHCIDGPVGVTCSPY